MRLSGRRSLRALGRDVYEKLIFEGEHICMAALPDMAERTVTLNGHSKAYAMTGWRLGWATGPAKHHRRRVAKLQSQSVTSAAAFTMTAGGAALNGPQDCVQEIHRLTGLQGAAA